MQDIELFDTIRPGKPRKTQDTSGGKYYGTSIVKPAVNSWFGQQYKNGTFKTVSTRPVYDNPWESPLWKKWQGRADKFWCEVIDSL